MATKYRVLIETVPFRYEDIFGAGADGKHTYGTAVSHQLIEFDTKDEADYACTVVQTAGIAGLYMRSVWKLYRP